MQLWKFWKSMVGSVPVEGVFLLHHRSQLMLELTWMNWSILTQMGTSSRWHNIEKCILDVTQENVSWRCFRGQWGINRRWHHPLLPSRNNCHPILVTGQHGHSLKTCCWFSINGYLKSQQNSLPSFTNVFGICPAFDFHQANQIPRFFFCWTLVLRVWICFPPQPKKKK